ncbi:MAG: nucleoside deaminase [Clostridia bacterium]|nr:nucleoside deaminase [Clostridia bacterium]
MNMTDYLRRANEIARKAREEGNTPFGAVLVGPDGTILMEQGNAEHELGDATAHAEMTLASRASRAYSKEFLKQCTLFTTCEPCPMCSGGIYWSNIGRCVYGITEKRLLELTGSNELNPTFSMGADKVFAAGQKDIALEGPFSEVEEEIVEVHRGFWD